MPCRCKAAGQPDAAIEDGARALQIWLDDAEACNNLGFALYLKGQLDDAIFISRTGRSP